MFNNKNKLLFILIASFVLPQSVFALGFSPGNPGLDSALIDQRYEYPFTLSDSQLGQEREFSLEVANDPYGLVKLKETHFVLKENESIVSSLMYFDTHGIEPGSYEFTLSAKEVLPPNDSKSNRVAQGVNVPGLLKITDTPIHALSVPNAWITKEDFETDFLIKVHATNEGNLPEQLDSVSLDVFDTEGKDVFHFDWKASEEIPPFSTKELQLEVNAPLLIGPGNYKAKIRAYEKGELIFESKELLYQVLKNNVRDGVIPILLVLGLTVSLYLYFFSRPKS